MPTRITGLKGYVAEAVAEFWLSQRFPSPNYEIVQQILPVGVNKKGGPYLDLGVIQHGTLKEVYEVKGQDYIFGKDDEINKSLWYIWNNKGKPIDFESQDRRTFAGSDETKGFLLLLAPPNEDYLQKIGKENVKFVRLFREVWEDIDSNNVEKEITDRILRDIGPDVGEVLSILRNPTQGPTKLKPFLEYRCMSK